MTNLQHSETSEI